MSDVKTEIIKPVEGLASISSGLQSMMGAFLAPALAELDIKVRETRDLVQHAKNDLNEHQKRIQEEIKGALEEPKALFQECLAALDRLEIKITAVETQSRASFD